MSEKFKIAYLANVRLPTGKAHGTQIMKMCESFADAGAEVDLVIPDKKNFLEQDPFVYYKIKKSFSLNRIPTLDLGSKTEKLSFLVFMLDSISFALKARRLMFGKETVIYTRDYIFPLFLSAKKSKIILEVHDISNSRFFLRAVKKSTLIITITNGLRLALIEKGIPAEKIFVASDAVDLKVFDIPISQEEARKKLSMPLDRKVVMYSGHLYDWKGAHILADAALIYGNDIIHTAFVGGTEPWISEFKKKYGDNKTIKIVPAQEKELIPIFLKAADVLVIPNSGKTKISSHYTSPLKLFEYMAAKKPIVSSDLPSMREILNENNALFFESDNPEDLAEKINFILVDEIGAKRLAEQAHKDVQEYTWTKRAEKILGWMKK